MSKLKPDSLLQLVFPSDPQVSPDGRQVVFVLSSIHEEDPAKSEAEFARPRYRGHLHWSDGVNTRQLTHAETGRGDAAPRWSPDGQTLAFIRSSGEVKGALMLLPMQGGEARRVTHFKQGVSGVAWSPDGRYLSFLSGGDTEDKRDERGQARVITKPLYRFNGLDWLPEAPAKLWLYDVQEDKLTEWYAPEIGLESVVWLPDSSGVLFVSAVDERARYEWRNEVFRLNLKGHGKNRVKQVTHWNSAISGVVPHPDGERLALLGRPEGKGNTEYSHVYLIGKNGQVTRMDEGHDFPVGNSVGGDCHVGGMPGQPAWLDDSTLVFSSTVRGSAGLFTATLDGQVKPFIHDPAEVIAAFTANVNGHALLRESPTRFPEVELNGVQVTKLNENLPFKPLKPQKVTFTNDLGTGEGWVLLPPGLKKKDRVPALLNIHGGPHTDYGYGFQHEFQLFAARGYGVCYSNPRGSSGYGQAWQAAIHGRWGTVDFDDLMAFFDTCLKEIPALDSKKTAVMGGSYGGLMTNWITGHTGRFQAAITDRSICNYLSFNGTSDIGLRFWHHELGLSFHRAQDAQKLWDLSPLKYVENVKTPTLIVHSVLDHRCPIEQAEQWYAALNLLDVPARFVRFPGEDHELSRSGRPDRRITRLQEYLDWLERWLS